MQDRPDPEEIIGLVAEFLRAKVLPSVSGRLAFDLRVSINLLDLAGRQLAAAHDDGAEEEARLAALVGGDATADKRAHELCRRIADGLIDLNTPGLRDHLWAATMRKLAVDQPNYAAYVRERALEPAKGGTE